MRQQEPIRHISIVFHIYLNFYKHYLTVGNKLQTKLTLTQENEGHVDKWLWERKLLRWYKISDFAVVWKKKIDSLTAPRLDSEYFCVMQTEKYKLKKKKKQQEQ